MRVLAYSAVVVAALMAGRLPAAEIELPKQAQIAGCSADSVDDARGGYFREYRVTCADLMVFLADAAVASETQWHSYSHVALADRMGWLALHDGTKLRWMVRPGGLAALDFHPEPPKRRTLSFPSYRRPGGRERWRAG